MATPDADRTPTSDLPRVPFSVIGGFLGAGKTTLVNRLLRDAGGERIAVVVNDVGDVPIDADLIAEHDGSTITLTNGCICCSLSDEFALSLPDLLAYDPPLDRVVVEASGVSDPGAVAQYGTLPGFRLDGVIVLADAETVRERAADTRIGPQVVRQLERADLVVLTKTDLVSRDDVDAVRNWLAATIGPVPVVEAAHGDVDVALLLGVERTRPVDELAPVHHGMRTATVAAAGPVPRRALDAWLDALPPGVLRAKGRLHTVEDGPVVVHVVGRRRRVAPDRSPSPPDPDAGVVVVIGIDDTVDTVGALGPPTGA